MDKFFSILLVFYLINSNLLAAKYYVDSVDGNDNNSGISSDAPWKSINKVNNWNFVPGDVIQFKRGSAWNGSLVIDKFGSEAMPLTYTAYGTGDNPTITTSGNWSVAITIKNDWIIVENFFIDGAHEAGVNISIGAKYNIVRNCEITNVGEGVALRGRNNLITNNYFHDLTMVVNDLGGDNDYGAVGVYIFNSNNEVSYNKFENCIAPSFDYGMDGGMVELYSENVDNNYIHHNYATKCNGVFEVGGGSAKNNIIAYNVLVNNGLLGGFHLPGSNFGSNVENLFFENNTIIENEVETWMQNWEMIYFTGTPTKSTFIVRNNIFYITRYVNAITHTGSFTHSNNLYYLLNGTSLGFTLEQGEILADPKFSNLKEGNFDLTLDSPAIDKGLDLKYELDFEKRQVPSGNAPDFGAYEYPATNETHLKSPQNVRIN